MGGIQIYQIVLASLSPSHLSSAAVPEPDNVAHPRQYRFAATSELGFGSLAYNCITDSGVHTWNHWLQMTYNDYRVLECSRLERRYGTYLNIILDQSQEGNIEQLSTRALHSQSLHGINIELVVMLQLEMVRKEVDGNVQL